MKKEALIILLILFSLTAISSVSAGTDEIYNGWHRYRDTFQVGDDVYRLRLLETDLNQLRVDFNNYTVLLPIDSCQPYNEYEFCYDEYSYDANEVDISELGVVMPGVHFRVLKKYAESISSYLNLNHYYESTVYKDTKDTVYVKLENTGTDWANPIKYEVTVPEGVEITSKRQFTQIGNKLSIVTSLSAGESIQYEFTVKPTTTGKHTFNYLLSATDESNGEQNSTGSFDMESPISYEYSSWLTPESVGLYQDAEIGVWIKNDDPVSDLTIHKVEIKGSPTISTIPTTKTTLYQTKFGEYKGNVEKLGPGEEANFKIKLTPYYTGTYPFDVNVEFELLNSTFYENVTKNLSVTEGGIQSNLWLSKYDVISGSQLFLYFTLENFNDNLIYTDFDIKLDGGFFSEHTNLSALNNNQKVQLMVKELTVPITEQDTDYNVTADIEYKNPAGQLRTLNNQVTLHVSGTGTLLTMRQEANKETVNRGEEVIIENYVGNLKDDYFGDVNVVDQLPQGISIQVGQASNKLGLQGKQEKRAYLYKIRIPDDYDKDKIEIKSTATIPEYNYQITSTKTIYISDPQPQPQEEQNQDLNVTIEDTGPEEKESIWTKVFKGIGEFFTKLFSRND